MSGKTPLETISDLKILLDESLDPNVAKALALVKYNINYVGNCFNGRDGVQDPEIIEYCKVNNCVWVTADEKARKQWVKNICSSGIKVVWIHRRNGIMSGKQQLRIISYLLPRLASHFYRFPNKKHYKITTHGDQQVFITGFPPDETMTLEQVDLISVWAK